MSTVITREQGYPGLSVEIIRVVTTSTLAQVTTAGWWNNSPIQGETISPVDQLLICYAYGTTDQATAAFNIAVGANGVVTLSAAGGGVTPEEVQMSAFNYCVDTGAAGAYVGALDPAPAALEDGLIVFLKIGTGNSNLTEIATFDLNGFGALPVEIRFGQLAANDMFEERIAVLEYCEASTSWLLQNGQISTLSAGFRATNGAYNQVDDQGIVNAYAGYGLYPGIISATSMPIYIIPANTNNGASTFNYNGVGALPIQYNGQALSGGEMVAGLPSMLIGNPGGGSWSLMNNRNLTASAIQLKANIKAALTGNIGGAGAGPIDVTVTGMTAASVVVASLSSSSNAVAVQTVLPGSGKFSVTFTGDPGASAILNYVAFIAAQ